MRLLRQYARRRDDEGDCAYARRTATISISINTLHFPDCPVTWTCMMRQAEKTGQDSAEAFTSERNAWGQTFPRRDGWIKKLLLSLLCASIRVMCCMWTVWRVTLLYQDENLCITREVCQFLLSN